MLNSLFQSSSIPVLEQVVNFSAARHHVLAGNVANLDTPGYRAQDLSPALFQERLKQSLERRDQPAVTSYGATEQPSVLGKPQSMEGFLYHDDSNDTLEQQVAEISKNQMQHSMALAIMSSQFRLLQAAISERA